MDTKYTNIKVMLSGRLINLSEEEINRTDTIARNFGRFTINDLAEATHNSDFRVRAYLVYAYEKGWIDVVERRGAKFIYERKA